MPAPMAATATMAWLGASASPAIAGPGQRPLIPQPMPKITAPAASGTSIPRVGGEVEGIDEERARHPALDHPGDRHRNERTGHDERQRRIPRAEQVEERTDALGVGHARQREPGTEYRARRHRRKQALHSRPPVRISATVAIPLAMNSKVAVIERSDSRDMPHTPWPLVQPEPRRVP